MDKNQAIVAFAGILIGGMTIITIIITAARVIMQRRRSGELGSGAADTLARLEVRMERLEQAVDAVAVEVERVAEGQRYTTKLLAQPTSETERA